MRVKKNKEAVYYFFNYCYYFFTFTRFERVLIRLNGDNTCGISWLDGRGDDLTNQCKAPCIGYEASGLLDTTCPGWCKGQDTINPPPSVCIWIYALHCEK